MSAHVCVGGGGCEKFHISQSWGLGLICMWAEEQVAAKPHMRGILSRGQARPTPGPNWAKGVVGSSLSFLLQTLLLVARRGARV